MIKKENIFINCQYENKNDAIDKITQSLGLTDEIKKLIFNREQTRSTELDDIIAMPHCRVLSDSKSDDIISISILNKPIDWGNNYIQIIILICNKSSNINYIKTLGKICRIFQDKKIKEQILLSKTTDDIFNIINDIC